MYVRTYVRMYVSTVPFAFRYRRRHPQVQFVELALFFYESNSIVCHLVSVFSLHRGVVVWGRVAGVWV